MRSASAPRNPSPSPSRVPQPWILGSAPPGRPGAAPEIPKPQPWAPRLRPRAVGRPVPASQASPSGSGAPSPARLTAPGPGPASPSVGVPAAAQQGFEAAQAARVPGSGGEVHGRRAIREQPVGVGAAAQQLLHGPADGDVRGGPGPRPAPARWAPSPRLVLPQRCPKPLRQAGPRVHAGPRSPAASPARFQLPAAPWCARAAPPLPRVCAGRGRAGSAEPTSAAGASAAGPGAPGPPGPVTPSGAQAGPAAADKHGAGGGRRACRYLVSKRETRTPLMGGVEPRPGSGGAHRAAGLPERPAQAASLAM